MFDSLPCIVSKIGSKYSKVYTKLPCFGFDFAHSAEFSNN